MSVTSHRFVRLSVASLAVLAALVLGSASHATSSPAAAPAGTALASPVSDGGVNPCGNCWTG